MMIVLAGAPLLVAGCERPPAKSVVASGQLYESGSARFDLIFQRIHAVQSQSAPAAEERRASRKPLLSLLAPGGAADDRTIFAAVARRIVPSGAAGFRLDVTADNAKCVALPGTKNDNALARASEESARLELAARKRLRARIKDIEDLEREIDHAVLDAKRSPAEKAPEIRRELAQGAASAKRHAAGLKSAESAGDDYLENLANALTGNRAKPKPTNPGPATPANPTPTPPPATDTTSKPVEPLPPPRPPMPHAGL